MNAFIYRIGDASVHNLINSDEHIPVNAAYRFVLWQDKNKDGIFQQSEKLTDEEIAQYDYQWEFTGQSAHGETGAQANTSNEDLVIPATNEEAAKKFSAQAGDGVQGYGLQVKYSKR